MPCETKNAVKAKCELALYSGYLEESLWKIGRRDDAWKMLDEAFAHIQTGERHIEAELLRYRGDFYVDLEQFEQAESAYHESRIVADR